MECTFQLQEGLCYKIVQTPTVSGAQTYSEICLAAMNEEKRQAELRKRERYHREALGQHRTIDNPATRPISSGFQPMHPTVIASHQVCRSAHGNRHCYACGSPDHLAHSCPQGKQESRGRRNNQERSQQACTKSTHSNYQRQWEITPWSVFTPLSLREITEVLGGSR